LEGNQPATVSLAHSVPGQAPQGRVEPAPVAALAPNQPGTSPLTAAIAPPSKGPPVRAVNPMSQTRILVPSDRQISILKRSRSQNIPALAAPLRPVRAPTAPAPAVPALLGLTQSVPARIVPAQAGRVLNARLLSNQVRAAHSAAREAFHALSPPAAASRGQAARAPAANPASLAAIPMEQAPAPGPAPAREASNLAPAQATVRHRAKNAPTTDYPAAPHHARPGPTRRAQKALPNLVFRAHENLAAHPHRAEQGPAEQADAVRAPVAREPDTSERPAPAGSPKRDMVRGNPHPQVAPNPAPEAPPNPATRASHPAPDPNALRRAQVANAPVVRRAERSVARNLPHCLRSGAGFKAVAYQATANSTSSWHNGGGRAPAPPWTPE
jgi:hypothetical protein